MAYGVLTICMDTFFVQILIEPHYECLRYSMLTSLESLEQTANCCNDDTVRAQLSYVVDVTARVAPRYRALLSQIAVKHYNASFTATTPELLADDTQRLGLRR